jgi:hypothetical protein
MGGLSLDLKLALGGSGRTSGGGAPAGFGADLLLGAGDFASDDGWTMGGVSPPVISGGTLNASGEGEAVFALAAPLVDARCYEIAFTVVSISSGSLSVALGGSGGLSSVATSGPKSIRIVTPVSGANQIFGFSFDAGCDAVVDNVIVREPLLLGPEICTNGTFDDTSGWTLTGTGNSIAGGVYTATSVFAARDATRAADVILIPVDCFRVTLTIANRTGGNGSVLIGGGTTGNIGANGTFTRDVQTNAANQNIVVRIGPNGAMDIDNVSVKRIL